MNSEGAFAIILNEKNRVLLVKENKSILNILNKLKH